MGAAVADSKTAGRQSTGVRAGTILSAAPNGSECGMSESTVPESLRLAAAVAWRVLVVGTAAVVVAYVVAQLRIIAIPCFVAVLLATQLSPLVDRLEARWLPRWVAAMLALLLGLTVVAGLTAALVGTVIADFDRLDVDFEGGIQEVGDFLVDRLEIPREDVDNAIDDLLDNLRNNTGTILGGVFSGASVAIELAAGAILAVVVLFFALKDGRNMWQWGLRLVPESRRTDISLIGQQAWSILGHYFRGTATVAFCDATFIGIALLIIGVPLVLPLVVLTFFASFIPIVGAVAAGIVAILVALVSEGFTDAVLVGVAVLAVQQFEGNVVAPVLVGRQVSLHPMVVILSVTTGAIVWGVLGAAIAVPIVAVATGLVEYIAARPLEDAIDPEAEAPAGAT